MSSLSHIAWKKFKKETLGMGGLLLIVFTTFLALSAYFIYIINALQFLLKLRMARLQHVPELTHA